MLQAAVDHTYGQFLQRVADGRRKTSAAVDAIAQGRVWAGTDARRLGLIDGIGNYQQALRAAARRARLGSDYEVRLIEPDLSLTQQLLLNMRSSVVRLLRAVGVNSALSSMLPGMQLTAPLKPVQRELQRWQRFATTQRSYAYCFCTVE
jgi:protease-4